MFCHVCYCEHSDISECDFSYKTKCPFGCDCNGYSEQQLQKHREENYFHHLDICYSALKEWGFSNYFEIGDTNLGVIEQKIVGKMKTDTDYVKNSIEKATYLKRKHILKKIERKEQMKLLEKAIDDCSLTSFNGKLVWIINEAFRELPVIHSPVFYTGKYGYKLRLVIKKETVNKKNSIILIFLKGINDPVLAESFPTKLSIKYQIDQKEKKTLEAIPITLNRISTNDKSVEKEIPIIDIEDGPLLMIRFEVDCSELDLPSID